MRRPTITTGSAAGEASMNETPKPVPAARNPTPWLLGLAFIGFFLMYHAYQASQMFGARFNQAIGNDAGNRGIGLDMVVGFAFTLIGSILFFSGGEKNDR